MNELRPPFAPDAIRSLRAGDAVRISGRIFTARDRVHKFLFEGGDPGVDLRGSAIFHCGPIVLPLEADAETPAACAPRWRVVAAGPTTSIREEPYMADIIARHGVRLILGKGGMGEATLAACRKHACAYVQIVGGAAAALAARVREVEDVRFLDEFGATEALWSLRVEGLEGIVGMDCHGGDLFRDIRDASKARLDHLLSGQRNGG
ncbi:MAG: FumA C-terminus/TtdB family hydratase beta subunit [Kiritimatiellia bacterium]|jgi:tartrate/fumarate subfamily iron-sulfur-dependent hydro-lyase beta chain